MARYDFAVVGRGMMGSAAARHLSATTSRVALVGPVEPADKKAHDGVYASHYDEGRITRTIDPDPVWAQLANAAIARYRAIERQSGISFFSEVGCLIAGRNSGNGLAYVEGSRKIASEFGLNTEDCDQSALSDRFPFFAFDSDVTGVFERDNAGTISPRRLVAAQARSAGLNGADVIDAVVRRVRHRSDHAEIELASGERITAAKVIVAAGGFTILPGLLPDPLDVRVNGRTVTLFAVSARTQGRLARMPSFIFEADRLEDSLYMLPPLAYPDGKVHVKIGTEGEGPTLTDEAALKAWFKSDGNDEVIEANVAAMRRFLPDLDEEAISNLVCVTTHTPTGLPAIGWSDSRHIAVVAGGCGSSAKSSDEIGRLGASLVLHGSLDGQGYTADFEPRFR